MTHSQSVLVPELSALRVMTLVSDPMRTRKLNAWLSDSHTRVVTLRGDMMRKNHGVAILEHLGLEEYITDSQEEFIEKCIFVATSPEDKAHFESVIGEKLLAFLDISPVRGMEEFMIEQVKNIC